jgi:hypothetical protein
VNEEDPECEDERRMKVEEEESGGEGEFALSFRRYPGR